MAFRDLPTIDPPSIHSERSELALLSFLNQQSGFICRPDRPDKSCDFDVELIIDGRSAANHRFGILLPDLKTTMPRIYSILLAACLICGCGKTELSVEPISQEYNARFLTGKGLDPRYFSTKDVVQYYQVSGFEGRSSNTIFAKLGAFVDTHYAKSIKDRVINLNVLFYRKKWRAGYNKNLYESARDNENRTLTGHSDDLVAWITCKRLKGDPVKLIRSRSYFAQGKPPLEQRDTVTLK